MAASCAFAQSQKRPVRKASNNQNTQAIPYEDYKRDLGAIAKELAAIRQQQASADSERAKYKYSWWTNGDPPVWSNWAVVIVAAIAGGLAYIQFRNQRDAVRLTQRADLLIHEFGLTGDVPEGKVFNIRDGFVDVIIKNFGPTRASNFHLADIRLTIDEEAATWSGFNRAPHVIGGQQSHQFRVGPLIRCFSEELIARVGDDTKELRLSFSYSYTDVFGKDHEASCVGRFMRPIERFEVTYPNQQ